jgi:hypothetical protein
MTEAVIGIIFDFDETLGPDTISYVLSEQGIKPVTFWKGQGEPADVLSSYYLGDIRS